MEKAVRGYSLNEVIYQNNFFTVYNAEHTILKGQKLRITLINEDFAKDSSLRSAFNQNVMRLTFAEHDNLVCNVDMLEENDNLAILSKYIEFSDFSTFIKQTSYNEKIQICTEIFDLVKYLHSRNVFVTDLRPENFVVNKAGKVLLVNVGLINIILKDSDKSLLENIGEELVFTAPEIIDFSSTPNVQSDIYSLGLFLIYVFRDYLNNEIQTDNFVISDLKVIIDKAIFPELDGRYKYLRDFHNDLFNCLKLIEVDETIKPEEQIKTSVHSEIGSVELDDLTEIEDVEPKIASEPIIPEPDVSDEEPVKDKTGEMSYYEILAGIEEEKKKKARKQAEAKRKYEPRSSSTVYQTKKSHKTHNSQGSDYNSTSQTSYNHPQTNHTKSSQNNNQSRNDNSRNSQSTYQNTQNKSNLNSKTNPKVNVNTSNVLVLGILGFIFSIAVPFIGFVLAIIGLAQIPKNKRAASLKGRALTSTEKTPQNIGTLLCVISIIIAVIRGVIWIVGLA